MKRIAFSLQLFFTSTVIISFVTGFTILGSLLVVIEGSSTTNETVDVEDVNSVLLDILHKTSSSNTLHVEDLFFQIPGLRCLWETSKSVFYSIVNVFRIPQSYKNYGKSITWPKIKQPFTDHHVQSPTNVDTRRARPMFLSPIEWHQPANMVEKELELMNTGYYFEMALDPDVPKSENPYIIGGPLYNHKYVFEQLHTHWGENNLCGSEHSVDGDRFSMEVHVVFFKQNYTSFKNAKKYTDGVAVIAFFGQLDDEDNGHLNDMIQKLKLIREPNSSTKASFKDEFKFMDILFQQSEYISFPGSLTTADYEECVTWIMFTKPFPISSKQIDAFRQLKQKDGNSMIRKNDRPLQEFGIRPIIYPMYKKAIELYSEEDMSENGNNVITPRKKAAENPSFVVNGSGSENIDSKISAD